MKALVLAAAKSKKLAPFYRTRPKSMLPIAGRPILETILRQLKRAGISEVWIVVNHQKECIRKAFHYGKRLGLIIDYIEQREERGIGHAVSLAKNILEKENHFLLVYGDALMSGNHFSHLLDHFFRLKPHNLATICHPYSEGKYGNIYLGHNMKISKLLEKPEGARISNYIFGGSFVLEKSCFPFLQNNDLDMVKYYQSLIASNRMMAALWEDSWIDISYPWHILAANKVMMRPWASSIIPDTTVVESNVHMEGAVHIEENVHIGAGTVIKGPCFIGPGVYLGNNTLIRKNASIGPNCKIGYGTEIKNAVLFGDSVVGRLSFIGDSVVGAGVKLGSGTITVNHITSGKEIYFETEEEGRLNTMLPKLGAFIGDNATVGTGNTLAPGIAIPPQKEIADHLTVTAKTSPC